MSLNLAEHYEKLVHQLQSLLNTPECKQEAFKALRNFIDRNDLMLTKDGLTIDIVGNLSAMLQLAMPQMQKTASRETAFAILLVAGAHNPRCRKVVR